MRINGEWSVGDDGMVRPTLRGEILAADGSWVQAPFLVDTGADCTVLSASVWTALGFHPSVTGERLGGVGGVTETVGVDTRIQMVSEDRGVVVFRGRYAAFTQLEALDMSVLGRDILRLFAVIVDQPAGRVSLLRDRHRYTIEHG